MPMRTSFKLLDVSHASHRAAGCFSSAPRALRAQAQAPRAPTPWTDSHASTVGSFGRRGRAWSSPILVRLSELEPTATAFYRVALAAPAFLLPFSFGQPEAGFAGFRRGSIELLWLVAAGGFFAVDLLCLHWSLRHTSVVNATLFLNFAPIFVSLGAWVAFRELPRPRTVLSYIIAIVRRGAVGWQRFELRAREAFWGWLRLGRRRGLWGLSSGGRPVPPQDVDERGHGGDHAVLRVLLFCRQRWRWAKVSSPERGRVGSRSWRLP